MIIITKGLYQYQPFLVKPFLEVWRQKGAISVILRLIVHIWLFGMFLYLFGEPAIERYLAKKVMVVTSTRETGGTEAPALTLIAIGKNASTGWKKEGLRAPLHYRLRFIESVH